MFNPKSLYNLSEKCVISLNLPIDELPAAIQMQIERQNVISKFSVNPRIDEDDEDFPDFDLEKEVYDLYKAGKTDALQWLFRNNHLSSLGWNFSLCTIDAMEVRDLDYLKFLVENWAGINRFAWDVDFEDGRKYISNRLLQQGTQNKTFSFLSVN